MHSNPDIAVRENIKRLADEKRMTLAAISRKTGGRVSEERLRRFLVHGADFLPSELHAVAQALESSPYALSAEVA